MYAEQKVQCEHAHFTVLKALYFKQMSDIFWIERRVNFVPSPSLTIANGVPVVPMFDGTQLLSFQGKSAIKRKRISQGNTATTLILKILSTLRF